MNKTHFIFLFFVLLYCGGHAQINGFIQGKNNDKIDPIVGAKIKFVNAKIGTTSDDEGRFRIILPKTLPDTLIISAYGYYSDSIVLDKKDRFIALNILLYSKNYLKEIVLSSRKKSNSISRLKTLHVEELSSTDLRKAACCNLSESFETNASVDINMTDAVSGAKKIQLMGLDGVYTQLQLENIPFIRGIESSFGLKSLPGSWIESIQVTKGSGSVTNGFESMAGLVNMELKKPESMEKFFLNAYQNIFGRSEINMNSGIRISKKWTTGLFAHASSNYRKMDGNNDGFLDQIIGENYSFSNRWKYEGKTMESQIGINAYIDQKIGGQVDFKREMASSPPLSGGPYGLVVDSKHFDAYAKTGFFGKKPLQSLGIIYHFKYHDLGGQFGNRQFSGNEKRAYINLAYDDFFSTSDHRIKSGLSFNYIDIQQAVDSLSQNRIEIIPGIFTEYTFTSSRWSIVSGIRGDLHNLYGFQFTPRLHAKYIWDEYTDLRFTAGKGWRVPNYIMDNISLLASSKNWLFDPNFMPEESWNFGGSMSKRFSIANRNGELILDFFHTRFTNQLVIDRDSIFNTVIFKNLKNASFSNAFQIETSFEIIKRVNWRIAYKFLDVRSIYANQERVQVMIPRHRGFTNLSYFTRNKKWEYDLTLSIFGNSRLPAQTALDGSVNYDRQSEIFPLLHAQITYVHKKWDFYLGGENLSNYKQKDAIIDASNPFGPNFDATEIWGPIMGTNVYLGLRYNLKK